MDAIGKMVHLQQWFDPRQFRLLSSRSFPSFLPSLSFLLLPLFSAAFSHVLRASCITGLVSFLSIPCFLCISQFSSFLGMPDFQEFRNSSPVLMSLSKLPRQVDELVKTFLAL